MILRGWVVKFHLIALLSLIVQAGFSQKYNTPFKLLPSSQTGVYFKNQLVESDTQNILNQANIYNGGGVGIGDFNNV